MKKTLLCAILLGVLATCVLAGEAPRVDRLGDPLPPGAIARLGTTRLRCPQAVFQLCFSPDGKILASAGYGPVRLWDAGSGKELRYFGDLSQVRSLAFSPDGTTLAIGGPPPHAYFFGDSETPNLLSLYDTSTGKQIWEAEGHKGAIDSIAFTPDGKTLVTAGGPITSFGTKPELMVWDAATGERKSVLAGHLAFVKDVALLPCGERLVSVGHKDLRIGEPPGSDVRLWVLATGKSSVTLEIPSRRQVWIVKPTDGRTLAVVDQQTLYRWDVGANREPADIMATRKVVPLEVPDKGITSSPAITDDGKTLIVGCRDGTIRYLDFNDGRELQKIQAHGAGIMGVAVSPDGRVLATHGPHWKGETIRLWNATTGERLLDYAGHERGVAAVAVSSDAKSVATGGCDHGLCLWDPETGALRCDHTGSAGWTTALAFSPDGKTIASGHYRGRVYLHDAPTGDIVGMFASRCKVITSLAFSPDATTLAAASWDGAIRLHALAAIDAYRTIKWKVKSPYKNVYCVTYSPDGKLIAAAGRGCLVRVWKAGSDRQVHKFVDHGESVDSVAFSPDGKTLAAGSEEGNIHFWSIATGERLRTIRQGDSAALCVAFCPTGSLLASAGYDRSVYLWDPARGTQIAKLDGHQATIRSLAFANHGRFLVSGSDDCTALVWDTAYLTATDAPESVSPTNTQNDETVGE